MLFLQWFASFPVDLEPVFQITRATVKLDTLGLIALLQVISSHTRDVAQVHKYYYIMLLQYLRCVMKTLVNLEELVDDMEQTTCALALQQQVEISVK